MNDDVAHDKMKFEANNSQGESDPPTKVTGYVNIIIWMWPSHNDVKVANATAVNETGCQGWRRWKIDGPKWESFFFCRS